MAITVERVIEIREGVIVSLAGCTWWECARCRERLVVGDAAYFNIDQRVICGRGKPCNLATGKGK